MKNISLILTAAILGLLASSAAWAQDSSLSQAMIAAGKQVFERCKACHSEDPSINSFGPRLHGVIGREAGSLPRFEYSPALKAATFIWTEDRLRLWMADNFSVVPETRMRHVSVTDPAEQDYLLAFIKSLK